MSHNGSERFAYEIAGILLLSLNFEYLKDLALLHGKKIKNGKVKKWYEYILITLVLLMLCVLFANRD